MISEFTPAWFDIDSTFKLSTFIVCVSTSIPEVSHTITKLCLVRFIQVAPNACYYTFHDLSELGPLSLCQETWFKCMLLSFGYQPLLMHWGQLKMNFKSGQVHSNVLLLMSFPWFNDHDWFNNSQDFKPFKFSFKYSTVIQLPCHHTSKYVGRPWILLCWMIRGMSAQKTSTSHFCLVLSQD